MERQRLHRVNKISIWPTKTKTTTTNATTISTATTTTTGRMDLQRLHRVKEISIWPTKTKTTTTNATTITTAKTTTTGRLELQRLHRVKKDFVLTADHHKDKDDYYKCNDSNNHNRTHGASFGLNVSDNKNNKIIITTIRHMVRQRLHRVKKIPD